jgi:hypothetical protein
MRGFVSLFAIVCAALPASGSAIDAAFVDPRGNVEIRFVRPLGELSEFELRNKTDNRIWYFHWAGQGPEPAAYCRRADATIYICSEMAYLEGDDASGYVEWIHETVLEPKSSVIFRVRSPGPASVGIKFWIPDGVGEALIWSDST